DQRRRGAIYVDGARVLKRVVTETREASDSLAQRGFDVGDCGERRAQPQDFETFTARTDGLPAFPEAIRKDWLSLRSQRLGECEVHIAQAVLAMRSSAIPVPRAIASTALVRARQRGPRGKRLACACKEWAASCSGLHRRTVCTGIRITGSRDRLKQLE